jgi:glucuronoarabinoxylan endo-1,4-beta-xylanase
MASNGAPVDVLSIQNEPDFTATYESCRWNASQLDAFFHNFASGVKTPMMMPESFHYDQTLSNPILNDPVAAANLAYIGEHLYGAGIQDYPLARSLGKHIWMTEYLVNDQSIGAAIDTAQRISDALTVGNMSAYIWWKQSEMRTAF